MPNARMWPVAFYWGYRESRNKMSEVQTNRNDWKGFKFAGLYLFISMQ